VLLSRLFYVVLAAALAGALFLIYVSTAVSNRTSSTTAKQLLTSAASAVSWYLQDDARRRASSLVTLAVDPEVSGGLKDASNIDNAKDIKADVKDKIRKKLITFRQSTDFDAIWAIDTHGRVIASDNYEKGTGSPDFEMGGYAVVADAIHGWIRDDSWVLDGQIFRVFGHPVEVDVNGAPVGCILAAKIVDGKFAQDISDRTEAAVAFFAGGSRIATGAPGNFDKALLEVQPADHERAKADPNYEEKGKTEPMVLSRNPDVMVVVSRLRGDAWDLGAGYVVGYRQVAVTSPFSYIDVADEGDKKAVPLWLLAAVLVGGAFIGIFLSVIEHTLPLSRFRRAVADLASKRSATDVLKPSTFRGVFKKIAGDINDSLDKVAAKAGVERGPADLESVLGPLPAQPQMSAFAVPKSDARPSQEGATPALGQKPPSGLQVPAPAASGKALPQPARKLPGAPKARVDEEEAVPPPAPAAPAVAPPPRRRGDGGMERAYAEEPPPISGRDGLPDVAAFGAALRGDAPGSGRDDDEDDNQPTRVAPVPNDLVPPSQTVDEDDDDDGGPPVDEETEWRKVYADFISMKKKFGETTDKLTYEKFRGTLQRNKEALMSRHHCTRVKFKVYEKQGRAALKASPVK
jgi:hypothetical protein